MNRNKASRRFGIRIATVVTALTLVATLLYCRKHRSAEERAEWMTKRITKELDLNDSQKAKLQTIKDEILARHKASKEPRAALMQEAITLVRSDALDKAKVADLKKRHAQLHNARKDFFIEKVIEFHKVLTPEQRNKAADLMQKFSKHFSGEKQ